MNILTSLLNLISISFFFCVCVCVCVFFFKVLVIYTRQACIYYTLRKFGGVSFATGALSFTH